MTFLFLAVACPAPEVEPPPADVVCDPGSHDENGACVATFVGWETADSPPHRRDHHVTFIVQTAADATLVTAGGAEDNVPVNDLAVAHIKADGALTAWQSVAPLPEVMAGPSVAVVGSVVVVTGGYRHIGVNPTLSAKTETSVVQPDGSFADWTPGPAMAMSRFHHAMVAYGDAVYVVGGLTGNNTASTSSVQRATVSDDGTLSVWQEVTPLPIPRSHHGLVVYQDAPFVIGGLTGDPNGVFTDLKQTLRASISANGALGNWTEVGELATQLGTQANFVHAGQLYVLGGIENGVNTGALRRAPFDSGGALGAWEALESLPQAAAHRHQAPMHNGIVYAVGGALNHVSTADVFIGRFE